MGWRHASSQARPMMRLPSRSGPKDHRDHPDRADQRAAECPSSQQQPVRRASSHAGSTRYTWPPERSFSSVLKCAQAGEEQDVGILYRRFMPAVYRYILARVADIPTAEDLTSETFMAMMRGIRDTRAEDELGFAAWLLGIARNQILMHFPSRRTAIGAHSRRVRMAC